MAENTYRKKVASKKKKQFKIPRLSLKFLTDRRLLLTIGIFFILFSLALLIAFISFLFSGANDQSLVEGTVGENIKETGREIENWLGISGAVLSYYFIYKWFGVASFLFIPLLFFWGYRMVFIRDLISYPRILVFSLFFLFWVSLALGYIVLNLTDPSYLEFLSGGIGFELAVIVDSLIGWGTPLLLFFTLIAFFIFFFNVQDLKRKESEVATAGAAANSAGATVSGEVQQQPEEAPERTADTEPENRIKPSDEMVRTEAPAEEPADDSGEPTDHVVEFSGDIQPVKKKATPADNLELEVEEQAPDTEAGYSSEEEFNTPAEPVSAPERPSGEETSAAEEEKEEDVEFEVEEVHTEKASVKKSENYDPTLDLAGYKYPPLNLLTEYDQNKIQVTKEELEANKDKIVNTLGNYNIGIASIKATIGPTVTLYEIVPEAGIRISKIKNLEDDIALSLSALGIRIIAPIPGKGTIGIEVPNKNRETVSIRSVFSTDKFLKSDKELPVVFGKTINNDIFQIDLAKMPHLLIAGATGQGKSVGLNVLLTSLIYKKHPSQLKLVLVDPKKVELSLFSKIERHFLAKLPDSEEAIITDTNKVVNTLNSCCILMDTRYELLKNAGCRNLKEYNKKFMERRLNPDKGHRFMPYIVVVIDELADLMMTAGKEVETPIARLAQLARAVGIHLVVATQRPSVNVITGIIKANFPARISFKVTSKVDSRTILDAGGADQLVGMGDMLFNQGSEMTRIQCAFVDTPEVEGVCEFIGEQRGYTEAFMLPEFKGEDESEPGEVDLSDRDALFDDAARVIVQHQQGSTSLLQRRLKLGYNRAGRLIDQLEAAGIVGSFEGSKAREVLISDEYSLEQLLNEINNK